MNRLKKNRFLLFVVLAAMAMFALAACSGSDGAAGATGPAGPAGPAGPVTETGESCNICHTTGRVGDIANFHPARYTSFLDVTAMNLTNNGGVPTVTFHVTANGAAVTNLTSGQLRAYMADIVPAGTVSSPTGTLVPNLTGTLSTAYLEQWAAERTGTGYLFGTFNNNGAGDYSYTFNTSFSGPTTTTLNTADIDLTPTTGHTQRVILRLSVPSGSVTGAVGGVGIMDFTIPTDGNSTTGIAPTREFVSTSACQACHGPAMLGAAHASGYLDTRACVICHSPLYGNGAADPPGFMAEISADFPEFIHKIHSAIDIPAFSTRIKGNGYADVTFPQDVKNCVICHSGTAAQVDNWKTHPTRIACGSCHNTVDFAAGAAGGHPGGVVTDDNGCTVCHHALGTVGDLADVVTAHNITPAAGSANDPEFVVTLGMTPPAGAYYAAGEAIDFTVTLATNTTGLPPVAGTVYTSPQDAAGVSGGGLRVASLYVYGPRSKALSILPGGGQGVSLFTGTTNTYITTDATGFKYHFVVPSGLTSGTYMVRFRAGDYSRISDSNYKVESVAFTTIQIGTATVQAKIDGDACVECHGTGSAPFHDARHIVVFNTDECVSCHDLSGGHADPISNRVHAVHSQSPGGADLTAGRVWSDVTYPLGNTSINSSGVPAGAAICETCHTSGNTAYKTNALGVACYGCHGDDPVTVDHIVQNGGPVKE